MEMGTIVISTILIVICMLPFVLISGSAKKRKNQLKKALDTSISRNNGTLTDYEIHYNFAIGLDNKNKQIYYYRKTPEIEYHQEVNLKEIISCEVKKDSKRIKNGKSNYELIQRIALVFTSKHGTIIEQFEFFNEDVSTQLNGEIALAATWSQKVSHLLSENITVL